MLFLPSPIFVVGKLLSQIARLCGVVGYSRAAVDAFFHIFWEESGVSIIRFQGTGLGNRSGNIHAKQR